jgi:hypothetical protein
VDPDPRAGAAADREHGRLLLPERLSPHPLTRIAFVVILIAGGVFLFHATRGTTFNGDEWIWALHRRGSSLATFLRPHNGHFSLVPIAIYKLLFATAGLRDYVPYRALLTAAHLGCVVLVFVYAWRRVPGLPALLAATLILFLGPAWQDILWPFQVAWLISIGAGVGALILLDRHDRPGDAAACALLACSLASSGLGLPIALGAAVDVLGGPDRRRRVWVVAVPLAAYAVWWLAYQNTKFISDTIYLTPGFLATFMAATMSAVAGLAGRAGETISGGQGTMLVFGPPLLVLAVVALFWRVYRLGAVSPRTLALLTVMFSFGAFVALNRAVVSQGYDSRYLYVGAVFVVLIAVELARGITVSRPASLVAGAFVAAAVLSNIGVLRDAGASLRVHAALVRADLGALEIGRPIIAPGYVPTYFPGYPYISIDAGSYFAAEKALGSPAPSPQKLAADFRLAVATEAFADPELIAIHRIALQPSPTAPSATGSPPAVDLALGGTVTRAGACVAFAPHAPAAGGELQLTVPPGGLRLTAGGGQGTLGIRRLGLTFQGFGALPLAAAVLLRIGPDLSAAPWHVRVASSGRVTACGL